MATSKEFHDYALFFLQQAGPVTTRRMMGEYCVYVAGKLVGLLCDNCLLLKESPSMERLLPEAPRAYPYEGSKQLMFVIEELENTEFLEQLLHTLYNEL